MAFRLSSRMCVWGFLCVWLFLSTLVLGTLVLILYIHDSVLQSFFGPQLTRLAQSTSLIIAGWTLITFAAAIRTAKANRRSVGAAFFLFALIGFMGEVLIMIAVARNREKVFGLSLLRESTLRLVKAYSSSAVARTALDFMHARFDCCGVDEWHREWEDVPPFPERLDKKNTEPWVPRSCCLEVYQGNIRCGFATFRPPVSVAHLFRQRHLNPQAVVPMPWFTRLRNEPCQEKIHIWLAEVPVYVLMCGLALSASRILFTLHAVFGFTAKIKRKVI